MFSLPQFRGISPCVAPPFNPSILNRSRLGVETTAVPRSINPVDRLVGKNVSIFRKAKGLSQTALGDEVGVTFQQIQKYEKGINRIGPSRLQKIAEVLDVPISQLFDASGEAEVSISGPVVTELLADNYAVDMLKAFARISNKGTRRSLVHLANAIAEAEGS